MQMSSSREASLQLCAAKQMFRTHDVFGRDSTRQTHPRLPALTQQRSFSLNDCGVGKGKLGVQIYSSGAGHTMRGVGAMRQYSCRNCRS